jgi:hypothetical protein
MDLPHMVVDVQDSPAGRSRKRAGLSTEHLMRKGQGRSTMTIPWAFPGRRTRGKCGPGRGVLQGDGLREDGWQAPGAVPRNGPRRCGLPSPHLPYRFRVPKWGRRE